MLSRCTYSLFPAIGLIAATTHRTENEAEKPKNNKTPTPSNTINSSSQIASDRIKLVLFEDIRGTIGKIQNACYQFFNKLDSSDPSSKKKEIILSKFAKNFALLEQSLKEEIKKRDDTQHLIDTYTKTTDTFTPDQITEKRLSDCIENNTVRKHVVAVWQHLVAENKLDLLALPEEELYSYKGSSDGDVHPELAKFPKEFYQDYSNYHFGAVITALKLLASTNNLNEIRKEKASNELQITNYSIKYIEKDIITETKILEHNLRLVDKKPEDFLPGDFSFVADETYRRSLQSAYEVITKLDKWALFDVEPPADKGYMFWNDPEIKALENAINNAFKGGHSGASMGFTMRSMQHIHKNGWKSFVKEHLENIYN